MQGALRRPAPAGSRRAPLSRRGPDRRASPGRPATSSCVWGLRSWRTEKWRHCTVTGSVPRWRSSRMRVRCRCAVSWAPTILVEQESARPGDSAGPPLRGACGARSPVLPPAPGCAPDRRLRRRSPRGPPGASRLPAPRLPARACSSGRRSEEPPEEAVASRFAQRSRAPSSGSRPAYPSGFSYARRCRGHAIMIGMSMAVA